MTVLSGLKARATRTSLVQAVRLIEQAAKMRGRPASVGEDAAPDEEPLRFVASDRMALVATELTGIEDDGHQPRVTTNVMGLVGATPALPPFYSEIQLQRRRLRDRSVAAFLNVFDHRALSFFYRIARKYHWLLDHERAGRDGSDAATGAMLAFAGLATPAMRNRLELDDVALAPLAHHLGDQRRSAASVETVLRHLLKRPLRVIEAEPVWMALPPEEQSRIGGPALGRFARLGGEGATGQDGGQDGGQDDHLPDAALIGAAVLDVQHHYVIEVGPIGYGEMIALCTDDATITRVRELCRLAAGIEHRPILRLAIAAAEIPPLRLGMADAPALLGRTAWMALDPGSDATLVDCAIPLTAIG